MQFDDYQSWVIAARVQYNVGGLVSSNKTELEYGKFLL